MKLEFLLTDILYSLSRVFVVCTLTWILCVISGLILHKYRILYKICLPVINFFRQISPFVWLPFAIIIAGLGELPIGIVLFTAMFFPGVIMVYETIDSFPKDVYEEAITSGANRRQLFLKIELPMLRKQLINIFRILWAVGWSTVIAAEMLGVSNGLGFRILDYRYLLNYKLMLVYIVVIGIIGVVSDYAFRKIAAVYDSP